MLPPLSSLGPVQPVQPLTLDGSGPVKQAGEFKQVLQSAIHEVEKSGAAADQAVQGFLAGAGLPKTGRIGFELFDRNNLGITDFTEHVNYRRALEGELERSIRVLSAVSQARVHITFPKDSVFLDMREPAKASVLLQTRPG